MEILSVFINFILNKLFPNRNKDESIVIKGNNNQSLSITKICDNNNGQININSTVDNSTTKNITNNEIIITDDCASNKNFDWIDITGYFLPEEKICRYTAPTEGTIVITVDKDDTVTLINETKNCPGTSVELTDGNNKTLKISCSKNDIIRLEKKLNRDFHPISAKFYVDMSKK